jgi:SAM-dependent methyltransferase
MAPNYGIKYYIKSAYSIFYKSTILQKIFYTLSIVFILTLFLKKKEGFEERTNEFKLKEGPLVYDDFYANVYDDLVFSKIKNDYEIGQIVEITKPSETSIVLDIGSGTGHHVSSLVAHGFKTIGIDISPSMINKAKTTYPELDFRLIDALDTMAFPGNSFTHINCLYFTIYYIKNKKLFFDNCIHWLMPGGFLMLHLVNRDKFDPILPAGDPFNIISPQNYTDIRITNTNVKFDKFEYKADFELIPSGNEIDDVNALLRETFKPYKKGLIRQNEHKFYMPTQAAVLALAKEAGFIIYAQIDLVRCQYGNQFIYILQKPS